MSVQQGNTIKTNYNT